MQPAVHRPWARGMPRGCRGQSLVEMAVALPLILILMAGVLDLAHAYSLAGILANGAREGARYGANHATDADVEARVVQEAAGAPLTLVATDVTVTRHCTSVSFDPTNCDSAGSSLTVEVTYTPPLILSQALGLPAPTIRRHATMVIF